MTRPADDFNWEDEPETSVDPYQENSKAVEPIVSSTVLPRPSGPLFGHWSEHIAYLQKRERELVEELEITREDIMMARKRQRAEDHD